MEAVAIDYRTLKPLLEQVYSFAATLVVRLQGGEDLHVAEVSGRIDSLFNRVEAQALEMGEAESFAEVKPMLQGLLQDVVRYSNWDHITRCPLCKLEVRNMTLPPGLILEEAQMLAHRAKEGEDVAQETNLLLHLLAMARREPYFTEAWQKQQQEMLRLSEPTIPISEIDQISPSPDLCEPWAFNQIDLKIEEEDEVRPLGRVGNAWRTMEAFCDRHKINPSNQPWYLLLGNRNSGKTALLRTPEADFAPIDEPGEGPSSNVTWYYQSEGHMVLDVPGRMVADDADDSDRAQWLHLLDLLRTHRNKRPIDGIVMAVPIADVLASETAAEELASRLRSLLQVTSRRLKMRPPVYVVFTQCDNIFGMTETALAMTSDQRRQMLGTTPGGDLGDPFSKEDFLTRMDALIDHLADVNPHLLARTSVPSDAAGIFGFPQELRSQKARMGEFLEGLMLSMGDKPLYLYRGTYFTSSRPDGHPVMRALAFTPPAESTPKPISGKALGISLFTGDLFGTRIFPEKNAFLPSLEVKGKSVRRSPGSSSNVSFPWKGVLRTLFIALLLFLLIVLVGTWRNLTEALEQKIVVYDVVYPFTLIPGGTYVMGSPSTDALRYEDEDPHLVEVAPIYVGTYEVTQEQWATVMGSNPSAYRGPDFPVNTISWDEANAFILKLNEAYDGTPKGSFAFLTEEQWEYAARGGSTEVLPENLEEVAWFDGNSKSDEDGQFTTHPVGTKIPNGFGLYDTVGNASEWVEDTYNEYIYGSELSLKTDVMPNRKVLRGGSFIDEKRVLRPANRVPELSHRTHRGYGLRLRWIPDEDSSTGHYLNDEPWLIAAYFSANKWLDENSELVADFLDDMGVLISDAVGKLIEEGPPEEK